MLLFYNSYLCVCYLYLMFFSFLILGHTEGLCMMCVLELHTNIAFAESGNVISPELVTENLTCK